MSQFPEEVLNLSSREGFGYFPGYPGQKLNKGRYEIARKLEFGPRSSTWLAIDPQNDAYFSIKILTVYETLQKPSDELVLLDIAASHGYLNLYRKFDESSHHGTHLCLVFDTVGPSFKDLRLESPTKSLPRHIVQRAVACIVEKLEEIRNFGLIHGAVTAQNIVFEIDASRDVLDSALAMLPPCTIEAYIPIDGVVYPIVHSHPVPYGIKWNNSWEVINRCVVDLINLGHAQKVKGNPTWEKSRMEKSLYPPEIILGLPYSSKADVWILGCTTYHLLTGNPLVPISM